MGVEVAWFLKEDISARHRDLGGDNKGNSESFWDRIDFLSTKISWEYKVSECRKLSKCSYKNSLKTY